MSFTNSADNQLISKRFEKKTKKTISEHSFINLSKNEAWKHHLVDSFIGTIEGNVMQNQYDINFLGVPLIQSLSKLYKILNWVLILVA